MTSKTITDRAGDTVRLSTGSLTAGPGEITVKVSERFRGREEVAAVHVDPAALRAALDEVAPSGSYARTDEPLGAYTRHESPDYADGGVAAALIEKEAEQQTAEVRELRAALSREIARGNALQDALDATESRPLTPDAITDEMVERARDAFTKHSSVHVTIGPDLVRKTITAALTEPPARPEGAEDLQRAMADLDMDDPAGFADLLAERGVRVVGEEGPR